MIGMSDLIAILDKIPIWKTLKDLPGKVESLENKIAELETKLKLAPPPTCPYCFKGEQFIKYRHSFAMAKPPREEQTWVCQNSECGKEDRRQVLLKK